MKRFTSLFLIFALILTTLPVQTFAQTEESGPTSTAPESSTSALPSGAVETMQPAIETRNVDEGTTLPPVTTDPAQDETREPIPEPKDGLPLDPSSPEDEKNPENLTAPTPEPLHEDPPLIDPPAYESPKFNADPKSFLSSFQGKADVSLFTGDLGYGFPLFVPKGRGNMTPNLSLNYSSNDSRWAGSTGYGWTLPTNAIYRVAREGVDKLYTQDDYFGMDLMGSSQSLMVFNKVKHEYRTKEGSEGMKIDFDPKANQWVVRDAQGNVYTFGTSMGARQIDPADPTKVFKWMLEKAEDVHGNFMTFTYVQDQGAIYPATIRYTGFGAEPGVFEVKFILQNRSATYSDYKTGFKVGYAKQIDLVELWSYADKNPELKLRYDFDYQAVNAAVTLLSSIQVKAGDQSLPATTFEYFDGSEKETFKKLYALKTLHLPYGGQTTFLYEPATAYREPNQTSSNWLPFVTSTLKSKTEKTGPNDAGTTTTYDYRRGHYYFDDLDAYKREYAGFGKVTVTDPLKNKQVLYYHQSEVDPNNKKDGALGEFEDHISKKGKLYRQESYDSGGKLMQELLTKWDKKELFKGEAPEPRYQVVQAQTVSVDHGENEADIKAKASSSTVDEYGNPLQEIDYGEVKLLNEKGEFSDVSQDKLRTQYTYAQNLGKNLLTFPQAVERFDQADGKIGGMTIFYDGLPVGQVEKGDWTKQERLISLPSTHATFSQTYTPEGLTQSFTNARGFTTQITYDTKALYPQTVTNAKGQKTTYLYDLFFGQPVQMTDPNGHDSQSLLDGFGRIDSSLVENTQGQMTLAQKYTYDLDAKPVVLTKTDYLQFKDVGGQDIALTEKTFFDGLSRPIQTKQEAEGNQFVVTSQVYDERGQVKENHLPKFTQSSAFEAVNPEDPKSVLTYDGLGRPKSETNALGTTSTTYGAWSQSIVDPNGHQKEFFADAQGSLIEVKEHEGQKVYSTKYTYDPNKNLAKIVDAEGNVSDFTYDLRGKRLTQSLLHKPNDNTPALFTFTYDVNGNLLTRKDAKGQVTTYAYDELDRPITDQTVSETISYAYDEPKGVFAIGKLTSVKGKAFQKLYKYDLMGRMTQELKTLNPGGNYLTAFTYAGLSQNLSQLNYPDGLVVSYQYNNAGQMEAVPGYILALDYTPIGSIKTLADANGATTLSTYDPQKLWRMTSRVTTVAGKKIQNLAYTYDAVGNILSILDASLGNTAKKAVYGYDDLDRLTSATITQTPNNQNYSQTYSYSPTGNLLTKSDVGAYAYTAKHPQAVSQAGGVSCAYDLNGSLITSTQGASTLSYNDRGRLASTSVNGKPVSYVYDEGGERTAKVAGSVTDTYVNQYYEEELNGLVKDKRKFIYAGPIKVATINPDKSIAFHHEDHLSGASLTTNQKGNIIETVDYFPYGQVKIEEKSEGYKNDYLFTGQERDEETGLMYYGARYYDARVGRFMEVDPVLLNILDKRDKESEKILLGLLKNPQSLNVYSYVANNPLKYIDPTGKIFIYFTGLGNSLEDANSMRNSIKAYAENNNVNSFEAKIFNHGDMISALKAIKNALVANPNEAIVIAGHSMGGASAIDLARMLGEEDIEVDTLIQIDSVGSNDDVLPSNVKEGVNFYQDGDIYIDGEDHVEGSKNIRVYDTAHTSIDRDKGVVQYITIKTVLEHFKKQISSNYENQSTP